MIKSVFGMASLRSAFGGEWRGAFFILRYQVSGDRKQEAWSQVAEGRRQGSALVLTYGINNYIMRDFKQLDIWTRSFVLVKTIYEFTNQLPQEELYGLRSQINRAAISIPSNIAEGCGRGTNTELRRFLTISLGYTYELETQLLLAKE